MPRRQHIHTAVVLCFGLHLDVGCRVGDERSFICPSNPAPRERLESAEFFFLFGGTPLSGPA